MKAVVPTPSIRIVGEINYQTWKHLQRIHERKWVLDMRKKGVALY